MSGQRRGRRAVFLDRDGVIVADAQHLRRADQLQLLPGAPEALARLRAAGWVLVVVTNQSVVARGWLTEVELQGVHRALLALLQARGASWDAIYYCPHHPEGAVAAYRRACDCRKPNPGMLLRAAGELDLALAESVMVGDAPTDVEAGRRAGCRTVLLRPTARADAVDERAAADHVARDLAAAAEWILTSRTESEW